MRLGRTGLGISTRKKAIRARRVAVTMALEPARPTRTGTLVLYSMVKQRSRRMSWERHQSLKRLTAALMRRTPP